MSSSPIDLMAAVDKAIEKVTDPPRKYVGGSEIGDECPRKVFLKFRGLPTKEIPAKLRRTFQLGHMIEDMIVGRLKATPGVKVEEIDPETKRQFRFEQLGGHASGGFDGFIMSPYFNIIHPESWALLEIKSMRSDLYKEWKKRGVRISHPKYYGQIQCYMDSDICKARGVDACAFIAMNKDTSEWHCEEVSKDRMHMSIMHDRMREVVLSPPYRAPRRAYQKPGPACNWCDFKGPCWGAEIPKPKDCRQCDHAQATGQGTWICNNAASPHAGKPADSLCDLYTPLSCLTPPEVE